MTPVRLAVAALQGAAALAGLAGATACVGVEFDAPAGRLAVEGRLACEPDLLPAAGEARFLITFTVGSSGLVQGGGFRVQLPADPRHRHFGFTPPHTGSPDLKGHVRCRVSRKDGAQEGAVAQAAPGGVAACLVERGILGQDDALVMEYWGQAPRAAGGYPLQAQSRLSGGRGGSPIPQPPVVRVVPRPARVLRAVLPSVAGVKEPMTLALSALDEFGNRAEGYGGTVEVELNGARATHQFAPEEKGVASLAGMLVDRAGFARALVKEIASPGEIPIVSRSNPVDVVAGPGDAVLWGDLEFHTGGGAGQRPFLPPAARAGDGRGNTTRQRDAYAYARDVMRLDFAAATEEANSLYTDEDWLESLRAADELDDPPRFATIPGFQWNDRLVLLRETSGPLVRSDYRSTDDLWELEAALSGRPAVLVSVDGAARRPTGGVAEVYSSRNRAEEGDDVPRRYEPGPLWLAGDRAAPATVAAASGNCWGMPGLDDLTGLEPGAGGLTAVVARENRREAILEALARGRAWATTGPRIYLMVAEREGRVQVRASGTSPFTSADLVVLEAGAVREIPLLSSPQEDLVIAIDRPRTRGPALLFVRVAQEDGEMAWSSPLPIPGHDAAQAAGEESR